MPGSCNNGFRSRPSIAAGSKRSKGFEVNNIKLKNPTLINPSTPSTRAMMSSGRWRLNTLTAIVHSDSINTHNNKEPSCPPHTPATRYCRGSAKLEFDATYTTEKSLFTKEYVKHPKAIATK